MPIFVSQDVGGVPAASANNSFTPHNSPSCSALFYPATCGVKIEGAWLNSIISEIACAVDGAGLSYNCDAVCNLSSAILSTGSVTGWCGSSRVAASLAKGSALAPGDHWLNVTSGTAYYVDANGHDVEIHDLAAFYCCSSGRVYARCNGSLSYVNGTGRKSSARLDGICASSQQAAIDAGLKNGSYWINTSLANPVVYLYDSGSSTIAIPQPDFFACCNSNSLWAMCGGSYFDVTNCVTGNTFFGNTVWQGYLVNGESVTVPIGPPTSSRRILVMTLGQIPAINGNQATQITSNDGIILFRADVPSGDTAVFEGLSIPSSFLCTFIRVDSSSPSPAVIQTTGTIAWQSGDFVMVVEKNTLGSGNDPYQPFDAGADWMMVRAIQKESDGDCSSWLGIVTKRLWPVDAGSYTLPTNSIGIVWRP